MAEELTDREETSIRSSDTGERDERFFYLLPNRKLNNDLFYISLLQKKG